MCQLIVKCATLIAVIHGLRLFARRAGPRASGLILGLPSSTAILLVLCGREKGTAPAIEMADACLLGLIAAVALPMAYAQAVRRGWGLPAALAAAVTVYALVASSLVLIHLDDPAQRLAVSFGSILAASFLVSRIGTPTEDSPRSSPSGRWIAIVRTVLPVVYVLALGLITGVASPRWAGLVGSFPSMSTVVLAVTHLEEGAAPASRVARALPPANMSTAAFLAAFRFASPTIGMGWGVLVGYSAALINLAAIEGIPRWIGLRPLLIGLAAIGRPSFRLGLPSRRQPPCRPRVILRLASRHDGRIRAPHRRPFAPRLERLAC